MVASIAAMAGADLLAYVFWHRPRAGVERAEYEAAQRGFHERLDGVESACFRLEELPFAAEQAGDDGAYEDWYLIKGWAGVYELVRGDPGIPAEVSWVEKPLGQPSADFIDGLVGSAVWRRQMVLGP